MKFSRRKFVKSTAVALATAVATGAAATTSSLSGCAPKPTSESTGTSSSDSIKTYSAVCRYCGVGCGVLVGVKDGTVVEVTGDPDNQTNKGANCIKGMNLVKLLYGEDRLTKPLIRDDKTSKGTKNGLREATWEEALDLVAEKLKATWKTDKSRLAFWGSGQQPIIEGYALVKFWKAGLLSNNIDPNARLCMASAVVALMNTFQTDEPANCYADIDSADVFVTWGANMAEAHPVLYSRLVARMQDNSSVKHYDLGTITTKTSKSANKVLIFKPGTDLAIANYIANYLVSNNLYDADFVKDHLQFKAGQENLSDALEDGYDASDIGQKVNDVHGITFDEYAAMLAPYTLEYVAQLSGVEASDLEELAKLFADPKLRILSLWTMGVNQHNRGTWMNHNIYNIHLLSGKHAMPGCGAFSLTGQPTACGTAREVGTFSHRLPADLVVNNAQHRRYSEAVWDLPEGYLDGIEKPGPHTVKIFRDMSSGKYDFFWSAYNNWAVSMPNLTRFLGKGDKKGLLDTFVVVNEVYPTLSCDYADVVFPVSLWVEREGQFGNAERRTAIFEKAIDPPGDAMWDLWVFVQIAKRVLAGEKISDDDAFTKLFGLIWDNAKDDFIGEQREVCKTLWEEYRTFSNPDLNNRANSINKDAEEKFGTRADDGTYTPSKLKMEAKQLAPYDEYLLNHGLSWPCREVNGRWLGTSWRFNNGGSQEDGYDQLGVQMYGKAGLAGNISFYKSATSKPSVVFRPYEPPAFEPNEEYPFWFVTGRLLEQWHTGSMTRRIPELNDALPEALLYMNPNDAAALNLSEGDMAKVSSAYGSVDIKVSVTSRVQPPAGRVFAAFFAEETLINLVCEDVYCPLSKEPDYKKTIVKIEKR
ncbi:MAG: molybdopterin-dependent oxidoreductase [Coriobacteriales bacterium]|jgi:nitrate reductase NapA|nr:molybdopterin-dependent oxidoreductase [Coriobacteriales bacterium]